MDVTGVESDSDLRVKLPGLPTRSVVETRRAAGTGMPVRNWHPGRRRRATVSGTSTQLQLEAAGASELGCRSCASATASSDDFDSGINHHRGTLRVRTRKPSLNTVTVTVGSRTGILETATAPSRVVTRRRNSEHDLSRIDSPTRKFPSRLLLVAHGETGPSVSTAIGSGGGGHKDTGFCTRVRVDTSTCTGTPRPPRQLRVKLASDMLPSQAPSLAAGVPRFEFGDSESQPPGQSRSRLPSLERLASSSEVRAALHWQVSLAPSNLVRMDVTGTGVVAVLTGKLR